MQQPLLRRQYILPAEHGAWIWLLGPYFLGWAAGGRFNLDLVLLLLASLFAFLSRQPLTILAKVSAGRRRQRDQGPALVWSTVYLGLGAALLAVLIARGHTRLPWLALPGIPIFLWHLWLVRQRQERGQVGIEIVASGVLALVGPAAYWVARGESQAVAWLLWGVAWFQSAASIVQVYLRLDQRNWESVPAPGVRLKRGSRSLAYSLFNLGVSVPLARGLGIPLTLPLAFALQALDVTEGVLRPARGLQPKTIGLRQLASSLAFYILAGHAFSHWATLPA